MYEAPASSANSLTSVRFDNHIQRRALGDKSEDATTNTLPFLMRLVAGKNLPPSDTVRGFLVNETFVKKLEAYIGRGMYGKGLSVNGGKINSTITGS